VINLIQESQFNEISNQGKQAVLFLLKGENLNSTTNTKLLFMTKGKNGNKYIGVHFDQVGLGEKQNFKDYIYSGNVSKVLAFLEMELGELGENYFNYATLFLQNNKLNPSYCQRFVTPVQRSTGRVAPVPVINSVVPQPRFSDNFITTFRNSQIVIRPNPRNILYFSQDGIQNTLPEITINCDELRFPTNPEESFYTQLVDNAKNYDTTFTKESEIRKALLNQAYLECFKKRFNNQEGVPDDFLKDILDDIRGDLDDSDKYLSNQCSKVTTTTTTTTTNNNTTTGPQTIIGDLSLKDFDNLLYMFEQSPEALKNLNVNAFNEFENPDSPLTNLNLNNLAKENKQTTTTVITNNRTIQGTGENQTVRNTSSTRVI
jgi:hypothetical protein